MVKKIVILSLLCVCIGREDVSALNLPQEIVRALENRDARSVGKHFNSSVELIFSQSEGVYGKSQAEQILKDFFDKHGPDNFRYNHLHSINKDNKQYFIGELYTAKGNYRIHISMKDQCIHLMRIENND